MILKVYVIRDAKTSFMTPTFDVNDASARRNFAHAVNHTDGLFHSSPDDFDLYCIGEFSSDDGVIISYPVPEFICSGASVVERGE